MSLAWHESKKKKKQQQPRVYIYGLRLSAGGMREAGIKMKAEVENFMEWDEARAIGGEIIRGSRAAERKKKTRAVNFHVCRCGKVPAE